MSKGAVDQVIKRAIGDAAFRAKLQSDPASALTGFDLTKDERSAITSGDPKRLTALGVDQRMSKAFEVGAHGGAAVSKTISPEAAGLTSKSLIDETSATGNRLDEGFVTRTTAAREAVDVSGDFNRLDEGTIGQSASKFETTVDRRADGFLAKELDEGLPTASSTDQDAPNTMDAEGNTITE